MKTKLLASVTLAFSLIGSAYAAGTPILNISGGVTPWATDATAVNLSDAALIGTATGIYAPLAGGSVVNYATSIGLDIEPGDYSSANIRVFDSFTGLNDSGITTLFNTYFLLNSIDDVVRTTTSTGQTLRVDTKLEAVIAGQSEGVFDFRWELSHNGSTGSYSVSSLITPFSAPLPSAVPVPAALWLFGPSLLGLMGYTRRKA